MELVVTKELENMRKFMKEKGDNFIMYLISRRIDEGEYESWESYRDVYQKFFSQVSNDVVVVSKDKQHPRKNNYKFIIKVQLNSNQYYNIIISKNSCEKFLKLGNYKKDLL